MSAILHSGHSIRNILSVLLSISMFMMVAGTAFASQEDLSEALSERMEQVNILSETLD